MVQAISMLNISLSFTFLLLGLAAGYLWAAWQNQQLKYRIETKEQHLAFSDEKITRLKKNILRTPRFSGGSVNVRR